ncbi:MAG: ATP-grasp domain-containing protein [Spirochaetaceae bacterium]|nr:MAG: ATP-grasp domain-containing protein [Spirochaetaceae bacterium]
MQERKDSPVSAPVEPPARVIVTYGRSLMSLVIAHSLSKRGIEVIGCDDVELTVLSFSRYVKRTFVHAPLDLDPEAFIADLLAKVRRLQPQDNRPYVLMPVFRETELIARYRDRFEPYITVAAPSFEGITRVHPKDKLFRTAGEMGVPVPRTWQPQSSQELRRVIPSMRFPVLIKPPDQVGGRGIEFCRTEAELQDRLRRYRSDRYGRALIQEVVPGDDYCLTVLFERGCLKASMAYKNLRKFPPDSGAGIVRETVDDRQFLRVAQQLLGPLSWNGIAELDFRWDGNPGTNPSLIEVNPRFWAGLFQSVESGIDFPWLLYRLTVSGQTPTPHAIQIGKRTKIPGLWLLGAIHDATNSETSFESLRSAWREAWHRIENKQISDAFQILSRSLEGKASFRETVATLRKIIHDGRNASNDLFYRDDPFIVLGVMFILASLIRYGKLPPEITNR